MNLLHNPALCPCSYQLCLFCYDRLKTEFSNRCPNCRVEYDSDFQAGLRRRQERVAQLQREAAAEREAAKAAALAAAERPADKLVHPPPPPPPPRAPRSPRSPRKDLHIEQEQLWPALGAAQASSHQASPAAHAQQHRPAVEPAGPGLGSPPPLAAILPQPAHGAAEQEASSSSSADTAATTPQSPVCSVVAFRALPPAPACGSASKLAVAPTTGDGGPLHGRCSVLLQRGSGLGVEADPEGASLAASLQEAVRAGSLSVKQAAASLASYLRQRQLHAAAGGSASSSPGRGSGQPSSVGSSGAVRVTPFSLTVGGLPAYANGGVLPGEAGPAPCDSVLSVATSASLSHWASSGTLPMPSAQPGVLGSGWQQAQQAAPPAIGSPVRDNDRLPLFMRRGSLPAGPNTAAPSVGSPGSASGSSAASFPGFPSGSSSPTQELKRTLLPPPGFGPTPLGSTGIAALPRFR
jgi:hypothetical protein